MLNATPRGINVRTVAAWLCNRMDKANNATANNQGAAVTKSEMELEIGSELPLKKVPPIHAIPKIATTAVAPAVVTNAKIIIIISIVLKLVGDQIKKLRWINRLHP